MTAFDKAWKLVKEMGRGPWADIPVEFPNDEETTKCEECGEEWPDDQIVFHDPGAEYLISIGENPNLSSGSQGAYLCPECLGRPNQQRHPFFTTPCDTCGGHTDTSCWGCDTFRCPECDPGEMRSDLDDHTYCDSCGPEGRR